MDKMEALEYLGWHFLCSGEQLPTGVFQAAVRYKAPPDGHIRTLVLDSEKHDTAGQALECAKELARKWADEKRSEPPRESRRLQHLRRWSHEEDEQVLT